MADTVVYPQPSFYFQVNLGSDEMQCAEVSGLNLEYDEMTYRYGSSKAFSVTKMPGLRKAADITIKKGVFKKDSKFYDWFNDVKMNVPQKRQTVTVLLLDEDGGTVMTWELGNAYAKKVTSPGMKADSSAVAIEEMVISCETLTIKV
jgi:phage tail-like protein